MSGEFSSLRYVCLLQWPCWMLWCMTLCIGLDHHHQATEACKLCHLIPNQSVASIGKALVIHWWTNRLRCCTLCRRWLRKRKRDAHHFVMISSLVASKMCFLLWCNVVQRHSDRSLDHKTCHTDCIYSAPLPIEALCNITQPLIVRSSQLVHDVDRNCNIRQLCKQAFACAHTMLMLRHDDHHRALAKSACTSVDLHTLIWKCWIASHQHKQATGR